MSLRGAMGVRFGVLLVGSLACAAHAGAQRRFSELGKLHFPEDGYRASALVVGDVDGDRDPDVLTSATPVSAFELRLYRNDGRGVFGDAVRLGPGGPPLLGDLDGDGDLDILSSSRVLLNDGRGGFAVSARTVPAGFALAPTLVDLDADGDLDVVADGLAPFATGTRIWFNDGRGNFADVSRGRVPTARTETGAFAVADLDGDGDLDIALANQPYWVDHRTRVPGPTRLYVNVGNTAFQDATSARLPSDPWDTSISIAAVDVDRDRDLDLIVGNLGTRNRLYRNDGSARFTDATALSLPASFSGAFSALDVDGDGDPDLVAGGRLFINIGAARFREAAVGRMPPAFQALGEPVPTDVDGDGDLDLAYAGNGKNRLLLNDGRGSFLDASASPMPELTRRASVLGDVDGDGDADVVVGSNTISSGHGGELYRNDGRGGFTLVPSGMPSDSSEVLHPMRLFDADGDRDLDLIFFGRANGRSLLKLYENNGNGRFTDVSGTRLPAASRLAANRFGAYVLGDVDRDGDVDVLLVVDRTSNHLFLNDGRGSFREVNGGLPAATYPARALAMGDVDGDGDIDVFVGGFADAAPTVLWLGDGAGRFVDVTATRMPRTNNQTNDLALGDLDGDGDLDLLVGSLGSSSFPQSRNRIYWNDGRGVFREGRPLSDRIANSLQVALVDIDRDGDLDAFADESLGGRRLYLNDGKGSFRDSGVRYSPERLAAFHFGIGDVDGDADPDVFMQGRLLANLHAQAHTPLLARLGESFSVDYWSRSGEAVGGQAVVPMLADRASRLALPPFGLLGLDPARLIVQPPVPLDREGFGRLRFTLPAAPALAGSPVFFQGLLVRSPRSESWRLTNATGDVMIR